MKHRLLFLLLLLGLAPAARAQSANPAIWCPPGATWTYGWGWWQEVGTLTVRYARDTVVAGQSAQLLTRSLLAYDPAGPSSASYTIRMSSVVTRTVADRVEVLANGQFYTLYNFAAQPGTSWLTPRVVPSGPCPAEIVQVTVDSVGTRQIGGRTLRWFRAHLTSPAGAPVLGAWNGRTYEQLGSVGQYMQPQSPTCGGTDPGYMGSLTGFQATGLPSISYNAGTGALLGTAQSRAAAAGFTAYPNPSSGLFTLELPASLAPEASLRLLDLTGRVLRQLPIPASRQLDIRGLPVGPYTLLLLEPGQAPLARRLLLE
ncbi:MAG: hypothetical protein ACRYFZ_03185 [Janthinobacterium lividum]